MFKKNKLLNFLECLYLIIIIVSVSLFYLTQVGAPLFLMPILFLLEIFLKIYSMKMEVLEIGFFLQYFVFFQIG